ncbi:MAG: hypothetical protein QHJ73_20060, partial [Armatimonadota bacterium]|nr:hypothetical protein [Armatimonadota bacterium]
NVLVASGPDAMLDKIGADLARLDLPPPQIEVQAIAVECNSVVDLQKALEVNTTSGDTRINVVPATGDIVFRQVPVQAANVRARLKALESRQVLRLRAEPKVRVLNGRTATLFVGQQRYIAAYRRSYRGMRGEIRSLPVGVSLEVTPWTGGREITLQVSPSVSLVEELDPRTRMPVLGVRRANATVRLGGGETLLISGLGLAQYDRRERKVPVLGDLPLVGWLLRAGRSYRTDTDLAVFVSAREV